MPAWEDAVSPKPLALQAINQPAVTETIALSHEEAEQIVESIRDLRERVNQKRALEAAEPSAAPAGFRAALRSAFGGA
jgi:hypothetical protein